MIDLCYSRAPIYSVIGTNQSTEGSPVLPNSCTSVLPPIPHSVPALQDPSPVLFTCAHWCTGLRFFLLFLPLFLRCKIFPRFRSPARTGVRDEQSLQNPVRLSACTGRRTIRFLGTRLLRLPLHRLDGKKVYFSSLIEKLDTYS